MDDLDILLSLVENPTRRRILERIVREPSYPLQLSKELGVSTQAVMKNLALLEQGGMVERTVVRSDMGPNRILYSPGTEFTLVVDMRSHVFSARIIEPEESDDTAEGDMEERLREIDARIEELDRERSRLIGERSRIASAMGSAEQAADSSAQTVR
ncbi:MAG: helix-turn-helix domain-containing protein [Thermoplasmata archaeon]|nr:helix-turn-helix domain-containing protein [Thermoplasmata archaeon]